MKPRRGDDRDTARIRLERFLRLSREPRGRIGRAAAMLNAAGVQRREGKLNVARRALAAARAIRLMQDSKRAQRRSVAAFSTVRP